MLSVWGTAVIGFSVGISPWQTQLVWICPRYRHPADRGSEPTWPMFLHHQSMIFVWHCGSFSYTPCAVLCGKFLLHSSYCFMWGVSLTLLVLFYVGSFSYTPSAVFCGSLFYMPHVILDMWGISLKEFILCLEFLLHAWCYFMWGVSLTRLMLFYVGSFSYMPYATSCRELNTPCYVMWGVSLTQPMLFYVGSFSSIPYAVLCGKFLLHAPYCFM